MTLKRILVRLIHKGKKQSQLDLSEIKVLTINIQIGKGEVSQDESKITGDSGDNSELGNVI